MPESCLVTLATVIASAACLQSETCR